MPESGGEAVVIYGTGGIGKTSLAALAPKPVFFDLDLGAGKYRGADGSKLKGVPNIEEFGTLRAALHDTAALVDYKTIVIDSATALQQLAERHVIETVPHEKGNRIRSIEDYGFGKGYQHILEAFRLVLSDLDTHRRAGRHVVLVAHSLTCMVPNPEGEDFLQYQPDLQEPPKTGRIRSAVRNWCDHLVYIGADIAVEHGVALGCGSRAIYCQEMPHYWAKSRTLSESILYAKGDDTFWLQLLGARANG